MERLNPHAREFTPQKQIRRTAGRKCSGEPTESSGMRIPGNLHNFCYHEGLSLFNSNAMIRQTLPSRIRVFSLGSDEATGFKGSVPSYSENFQIFEFPETAKRIGNTIRTTRIEL